MTVRYPVMTAYNLSNCLNHVGRVTWPREQGERTTKYL